MRVRNYKEVGILVSRRKNGFKEVVFLSENAINGAAGLFDFVIMIEILILKKFFLTKSSFCIIINTNYFSKAMRGKKLCRVFQRAVGWCETVCRAGDNSSLSLRSKGQPSRIGRVLPLSRGRIVRCDVSGW